MVKLKFRLSRKVFFLPLTIITLFLISSFSLKVSATPIDVDVGDWLSYEVLDSSETENMFFGTAPTYTYFGNWSVISGDTITYNATSITESSINGTLFFGNSSVNTTFIDVRNVDAAFGLSISIRGWDGGFYANASDWLNVQFQIRSANTTSEEINNYEMSINDGVMFYDVMKFDVVDYFGQFTTLYYHFDSGILLKAVTSYGLYELAFKLESTNLEIEGYTKRVSMDLSLLFLSLALIPILKPVRRRFRKVKR
jgi:hypothetical protein